MTYVACEPLEVSAFADVTGKLHETREDAIDANFKFDLAEAVSKMCVSPGQFESMPFILSVKFLKEFIDTHEDMVRVMLGDRDAT